MFVKLILPTLLEAKDPGFRPIKYSLFPPLGLAALAGYLDADDQIVLEDEHVMPLSTDDRPDLVVMSVYITSAYRAYQLKDAFYQGGKSFYTRAVDEVLAEIEQLPGRHLYFLDDHLLGHRRFAAALFEGMRGMGRVFQGASTVNAILESDLIEQAAEAGMRSVFIGFETLNPENLRRHAKRQNLARDYDQVIRRVHSLGIMVNGSFVFGLDDADADVFDRTVEWATSRSVETATFHIMTPYPGTALHARLAAEGRITDANWDHYDTRHVVYQPRRLRPEQLLTGYRRAYRDFYRWSAIARGAAGQPTARQAVRHVAYAGGWKRLEPLWDLVIRARHVNAMLPLLEATLDAFVGARGRLLGRT